MSDRPSCFGFFLQRTAVICMQCSFRRECSKARR